ncbi:hypothetical protein D6D03_05481 [Aureobasidium pullulans]|nr:hypothetical protein D6D03_05481 [Aureobasidium pullulans]
MTYGDHHLTFRTSISIAQIPVFSLSLLIAYYFRRTHRMGWFCIGIFSIIRLVSASCLLALINEDNHSLKATVFVCENLGIMLFVFIFVEVLEWKLCQKQTNPHPNPPKVPILGYILPRPRKKQNPYAPTPYSRTSRAILIITYIYTLTLLFILWIRRDRSLTAKPRKNAMMGVVVCIPFMVIRLVYEVVFQVTGDMGFNAVRGGGMRYLFMTFLPEVVVVGGCVGMIWWIPVEYESESVHQEDGRKVTDTLRVRMEMES